MIRAMLETFKRLNEEIIKSEVFWGDLTFTKFEDGSIGIILLHRNHYYRYDNTSLKIHDFYTLDELKEFERVATDCIKNNTILEEY